LGEDCVAGARVDVGGFRGAVPAGALLSALRGCRGEVEWKFEDGKLSLVGGGVRAQFNWEEIREDLDGFGVGGSKAHRLGDGELGALRRVASAVRKEVGSSFLTGCVHFAPSFVEACSNFLAVRCYVDLGLKEECLVSGRSLGKLVSLGVEGIFDREDSLGWATTDGVWAYLIKYREKFPNLEPLFSFDVVGRVKVSGEEVKRAVQVLSGFAEGVRRWVDVSVKGSTVELRAIGSIGNCVTRFDAEVEGEVTSFRTLLENLDILASADWWEIGRGKARVEGSDWVFSVFLAQDEKE